VIFGRRDKPGIAERIRVFLWPRRSWLRSGKYFVKRILRLTGSPYAIAAGVAAGAFTSFTPFLGFHFIISWILAFIIGGNLLAAALGTAVGNPITFPFIWGATYKTGALFLGQPVAHGNPKDLGMSIMSSSLDSVWPIIKVMSVGAVPTGLICALVCYFLVRKTCEAYQHRRKAVLARKAYEAGKWRAAIADHDRTAS
jgi:uncharacterized protein (DUF2062 family)